MKHAPGGIAPLNPRLFTRHRVAMARPRVRRRSTHASRREATPVNSRGSGAAAPPEARAERTRTATRCRYCITRASGGIAALNPRLLTSHRVAMARPPRTHARTASRTIGAARRVRRIISMTHRPPRGRSRQRKGSSPSFGIRRRTAAGACGARGCARCSRGLLRFSRGLWSFSAWHVSFSRGLLSFSTWHVRNSRGLLRNSSGLLRSS